MYFSLAGKVPKVRSRGREFRFSLPLKIPLSHRHKEGLIPSLESPLPAVQPTSRFTYRTPALNGCTAVSQPSFYSAAQTNRSVCFAVRGPAGALMRDESDTVPQLPKGCDSFCRTDEPAPENGDPQGACPWASFSALFARPKRAPRRSAEHPKAPISNTISNISTYYYKKSSPPAASPQYKERGTING